MKRVEFIDFLKGLLILLVTVGHIVQHVVYRDVDFWESWLFKAIYMFHMPLFMAISGYVSAHSLDSRPAGVLLFQRLRAYVLPIFVWAFLLVIVPWIIQHEPPFAQLPKDIARQAYHSLWFLWALFLSTASVALAKAITRQSLLIAGGSLALVFSLPEMGDLFLFKYTFPFFLVGYFVASGGSKVRELAEKKTFFGAAGVLSLVCFFLWHRETYVYVSGMRFTAGNSGNIALRTVSAFAGSAFLVCTARRMFASSPLRLRQMFVIAGQNSICLYILQIQLFEFLKPVLQKLDFPTPALQLWSLLALPAGMLLSGALWFIAECIGGKGWRAGLLFGRWGSPRPNATVCGVDAMNAQELAVKSTD